MGLGSASSVISNEIRIVLSTTTWICTIPIVISHLHVLSVGTRPMYGERHGTTSTTPMVSDMEMLRTSAMEQ